MTSRKLRSGLEISRTAMIPKKLSHAKLKQTKISDWISSGPNGNSEGGSSDSEQSFRSCLSSSSSHSLRQAISTPLRKGSNNLKQSSDATGSQGAGSKTIVLQLDQILTCDAPNCNYHTSFKLNLERHKKFKHELKPFDCQECNYVTGNKQSFTQHVKARAGKAPIKCQTCGWATSTPSSLKSHMKQIHETAELRKNGISRASQFGKRFKCSKYDFRAVSKQEIHLHNYSHETERKHKCSFPGCDYRTKTACSLREHVKRHDEDAKKEFQCPLCSKLFWTRYWLHQHIKSHTKERNVKCSKCKYVTHFPSSLKKHMRTHAKTSVVETAKHNAGESLGVFSNEQLLRTSDTDTRRRDRYLNGSGNFLQNEVAKSRLELEDHEESPTKVKKLKSQPRDHKNLMETARKTTSTTTSIRRSPKKSLQKKHKCDHCDFTAIYKCKITRHAVVHRDPDDKLYSCSFAGCDFKTNWEDYVKKHYRDFHKSAPDLLCPFDGCGFQTKWKDTLDKHQRIHVKKRKKTHQCPMCRKAFYDSEGLKRHINIHTGERKYKCSLCDYVAGESSNFYAHRRKYHAGLECEPI